MMAWSGSSWPVTVFLLLSSAAFVNSSTPSTHSPRVRVRKWGEIVGSTETLWYRNRSVEVFKGIPFAEPPIGPRRFLRTVPLRQAPTDPFHATQYAPACMQIYSNGTQSEDCLYLNVWRPCARRRAGRRLPVIVLVYGGAFIVGHSQNPNYNGLPLAALHSLIVVNFNYRLGPFGFVDTSDLDGGFAGNQGLDDQRLALTWVRRHIADFGGDPRRITVMGCSAGAIATSYHIGSPLSNRLFSRAIIDAGVLSERRLETSRSSLRRMLRLAVRVGCRQTKSTELLECLRALPGSLLRDASLLVMDSPLLGFRPTAVTDVEAAPKDVAVLMGHSGNEGLTLVSNGFGINDPLPIFADSNEAVDAVRALLLAAVPYAAPKVLKFWPELKRRLLEVYWADRPADAGTLVDRAATFVGDLFFHCGMLQYYGGLPNATFYVFDRAFRRNIESDVDPAVYGSFHMTAHMHFVGAQLVTMGEEQIDPEDLQFTLKALRWTAQFAHFARVKDFPRSTYPGVVRISPSAITLQAAHDASGRCRLLDSMWTLLNST